MSTALITGSTRGIGRALAQLLLAEGEDVIVTGRDTAGVDAAVRDLDASPGDGRGRVTGLVLDVTDEDSVAAAAGAVAASAGRLDVLVNNAGILPEATDADPAAAVDPAMVRRTFATNVLGAATMIDAFLPLLRDAPGGRIVNVSSRMGSLQDQLDPASPYFGTVIPAYQASKAALNSLTVGLSKALSESGIGVVAVCPGFVRTDLTPMSRAQAPLEPEDAARVLLRAVRAEDTGTFTDAEGPVPW